MNIQPLFANGDTGAAVITFTKEYALSADEIITRYGKTVYSVALCRVGNKFDADDVFQDVFLIYFRKNPSFESEEHRKAWLIRTTLNRCKKILGSAWRKRTVLTNDTEDKVYQFSSDEENAVFIAMRGLPEKYRTVIHLYYFEDFSTEKIAEALRINAGTVRVRLKRGRDLMRKQLQNSEGEYFYE